MKSHSVTINGPISVRFQNLSNVRLLSVHRLYVNQRGGVVFNPFDLRQVLFTNSNRDCTQLAETFKYSGSVTIANTWVIKTAISNKSINQFNMLNYVNNSQAGKAAAAELQKKPLWNNWLSNGKMIFGLLLNLSHMTTLLRINFLLVFNYAKKIQLIRKIKNIYFLNLIFTSYKSHYV